MFIVKLHRIPQMCGFACVLLFILNSAVADPIKWNSLNKVEKYVVKAHKAKWKNYSESKQRNILKKADSIIKGIYRYKKWVKSLSKEQQIEIGKKFKEMKGMKPEAFKKYADKLRKAKK